MSGKLEANAIFVDAPSASSFHATRVRSESCTIQCGEATQLRVSDVLEAQRADITAGSVTLGKLLADVATVDAAGDISLRAAYVRQLEVKSRQGHVHVEGAHGSIRAEARGAGASVRIGGLTGSAAVAAPGGTATVHFDSLRGDANSVTAAGQCSVSIGAPAAVTLEARAASTVVVSPGLTGSFKASSEGASPRPEAASAADTSAPAPWVVQGVLTAWPGTSTRDPHVLPSPHHGGVSPPPAARGGSGKVRLDESVGVTGFYSPLRQDGGPAAASPAGSEAAPPSRLFVESTEGAVHVEVVSWQQAVRTRAVHRARGEGAGAGSSPLAACEWCSDASGIVDENAGAEPVA